MLSAPGQLERTTKGHNCIREIVSKAIKTVANSNEPCVIRLTTTANMVEKTGEIKIAKKPPVEITYDEAEEDEAEESSADGQLLLEIIRDEEERDLRLLVKKFRDQCRRYLGCHRIDWTEEHDRSVIDYLDDALKVGLFVSNAQQLQLKIEWNLTPDAINASHDEGEDPRGFCFFFKMEEGPFLRPDQFEVSFYHGCYLPGVSDLSRHWTKMARHFEQQTLMINTPFREFKHLMEVNMLKLRLTLISDRSLDEGILLKPSLVPPPPASEDDDEDRIELLERTAHQWIQVCTYNLELRDYNSAPKSPGRVATIHDEIQSLVLKYDVLKRLSGKLLQDEFQQVQAALKQANSVLGDELESLIENLQEETRQAKLTAKYLGTLRRPLEAFEKVKIHSEVIRGLYIPPLLDLPAVYQDACSRIIIIVKHVPAFGNKERQYAGRLLFMMGNQAVEKICQHAREVALDQLFLKGKPRECAEDIEKVCRKAINICTAIYTQTMKWHRKDELANDEAILVNFKSLDLRFDHLMNICSSLEQLGRYGDGIKEVTFSAERESDIGQSLLRSQERFVQLSLDLITRHKDALLDIHHPTEWYQAYNQFLQDTRSIEIQLVHDLEDAVGRCSTLWGIYELLMSFQHLYRRPLFTSVINSTANQLYKKASKEAKIACSITCDDPWNTPVLTMMTAPPIRTAASAQRARGYVNKIAKLVQLTGWAGSLSFGEKALGRCQLAHRLLGDAVKREFAEWTERLQLDLMYNVNMALHKFAVRRHFQRADWIQCNLDGVVFQVLQTIEGFDRLLIELPGQVSSLWQERNELRNVHGSVCAMCYYYNYIVQELTQADKETQRDALIRLEKAVQPCLNQVTWKQIIVLKRVVSTCYFAMDELLQELLLNSVLQET